MSFDSLSYMLDNENLERVFSNIHAALKPGGTLVFDLSLDQAYHDEWQRSCSIIEDEEACFVRVFYEARERRGRTLITTFQRKSGSWQRTDVVFHTLWHNADNVVRALEHSGFMETVAHCSDRDEQLRRDLGPGRACFVARKR